MQPQWGQHRSQQILKQPELMIDSPSASAVEPELPHSPEIEQTRSLTTLKAPPVQPWSLQSMIEEESIEPLEEMIQPQEENPFYSQSSEMVTLIPEPELGSISEAELSPNLEDELTDWPVELPTEASKSEPQGIRFPFEEIPQAQLIDDEIEEELERIQAEYASLNQPEDDELDRLESLPTFLEQDNPEPVLIQEPSQPQFIPQPTSEGENVSSNWPAPLIRPQRRRKLASLASIELPKLPKPPHWTPESESFSIEELAEMEPF
jgi:hypothetical protein